MRDGPRREIKGSMFFEMLPGCHSSHTARNLKAYYIPTASPVLAMEQIGVLFGPTHGCKSRAHTGHTASTSMVSLARGDQGRDMGFSTNYSETPSTSSKLALVNFPGVPVIDFQISKTRTGVHVKARFQGI